MQCNLIDTKSLLRSIIFAIIPIADNNVNFHLVNYSTKIVCICVLTNFRRLTRNNMHRSIECIVLVLGCNKQTNELNAYSLLTRNNAPPLVDDIDRLSTHRNDVRCLVESPPSMAMRRVPHRVRLRRVREANDADQMLYREYDDVRI